MKKVSYKRFRKTSSIRIFKSYHIRLSSESTLSFFGSRSAWEFKYEVDLIILAKTSGVSLMDLFGDKKMT